MSDYATLLREHTTLTCRSVGRFFLQGYVPQLQSVGQVCRFLRWQRRFLSRPQRRSARSVIVRACAAFTWPIPAGACSSTVCPSAWAPWQKEYPDDMT
jgi:hypothetical protein